MVSVLEDLFGHRKGEGVYEPVILGLIEFRRFRRIGPRVG